MSRTALDLWVGLFVAIGFAALVFLAMKVGNFSGLDGAETYRVEAPFDNIGGLKVRAPVKSSGVLVGRVAAIRFDTAIYRAVVELEIDRRYAFPPTPPRPSRPPGLLGEQYVGLEAGADVEMLENGDRVLITRIRGGPREVDRPVHVRPRRATRPPSKSARFPGENNNAKRLPLLPRQPRCSRYLGRAARRLCHHRQPRRPARGLQPGPRPASA